MTRSKQARQTPPAILAGRIELGNRLGKGQDNLVYAAEVPDEAMMALEGDDWVVKVSHIGRNAGHKRDHSLSPQEAAIAGVRYKQHKYGILKLFLGSHIPDSMFFASSVAQGVDEKGRPIGVRPAEITLQKRVPDVTTKMLSEEQKENPLLTNNLLDLFERMRYMYSVIGAANARVSNGAQVDAKLDLGGVSYFVNGTTEDQVFTRQDAKKTIRKGKPSPNLLVDPTTLWPYCIDYDQGDWHDGKTGTAELVRKIHDERMAKAQLIGPTALIGHVKPPGAILDKAPVIDLRDETTGGVFTRTPSRLIG